MIRALDLPDRVADVAAVVRRGDRPEGVVRLHPVDDPWTVGSGGPGRDAPDEKRRRGKPENPHECLTEHVFATLAEHVFACQGFVYAFLAITGAGFQGTGLPWQLPCVCAIQPETIPADCFATGAVVPTQ